jgi:hypothetical protein
MLPLFAAADCMDKVESLRVSRCKRAGSFNNNGGGGGDNH